MSFFNDAKEVAYQAVYGKHYQSGESCARPKDVTEHDGILRGELRVWGAAFDLTGKPVSHQTWAALATELQARLAGTSLAREINIKRSRTVLDGVGGGAGD